MKLLADGADLQCTKGSLLSKLKVSPANLTFADNAPLATKKDHLPTVNIVSFGDCKSLLNPDVQAATAAKAGALTPQPCVPKTTKPWSGAVSDVLINDVPVVTDASSCECLWKGKITAATAGQDVADFVPSSPGNAAYSESAERIARRREREESPERQRPRPPVVEASRFAHFPGTGPALRSEGAIQATVDSLHDLLLDEQFEDIWALLQRMSPPRDPRVSRKPPPPTEEAMRFAKAMATLELQASAPTSTEAGDDEEST